jgi:hypothetical protein
MPFAFFDYAVPYSSMAPASKAALMREEVAKTMFLAAKTTFEESQESHLPFRKHTILLLKPNIHLTSVTWGTFARWVKENHEGWTAKRREASKEEKEEALANNRGKSYFVDIVHKLPDPSKKKKTTTTKRKKAPPSSTEEDQKPAAKKQKKDYGPFPLASLPEHLQAQVLTFADVPTLGSLVRSSKALGELAKKDDLWEPHLKFLLEKVFDDAFVDSSRVAVSKRPNWRLSTEFRNWYEEHEGFTCQKNSVNGSTMDAIDDFVGYPVAFQGREDTFTWLLENVSLREYYKQAGAYAKEGESEYHDMMEEADRCPGCMSEEWACCCPAVSTPGPFHQMPRIQLFYLRW